MRIYQTCFFIIQLLFYLSIGLLLAIKPLIFFNTNKYTPPKRSNCMYIENLYTKERRKLRINILNPLKIIWFVIIMSITIYFIKPYFLDIPQLITGKLTYVTGEVLDTTHYSKSITEYVYLSSGDYIKFTFPSDVKKYEYYTIGFLTHTQRAIYCEHINELNGNRSVIGFPFKYILFMITFFSLIIFLIFISPYVKLKLFISTNAISIPVSIYYFIKHGLNTGAWISIKNTGFFSLIFILFLMLMVLFSYFLDKFQPEDFSRTYFFAQISSLISIAVLISLLFYP